jgi:hypothetical protein
MWSGLLDNGLNRREPMGTRSISGCASDARLLYFVLFVLNREAVPPSRIFYPSSLLSREYQA